MSVTKKIAITEFKCPICGEIVVFDANDPSTYSSKTVKDEFFAVKLTRFVVVHQTASEEHFNVVIVDGNGQYRGHLDSYQKPKIIQEKTQELKGFQVQIGAAVEHVNFDYLTIVDFEERLIFEYINTGKLKSDALIDRIQGFIKENREIYDVLPTILSYQHANKEFVLDKVNEHLFILYSFKDRNPARKNLFSGLFALLHPFIVISHFSSPTNLLLSAILRITSTASFSEEDLHYVESLATQEVFLSNFSIHNEYKDNVLAAIERFAPTYPCLESLVKILLREETSVARILNEMPEEFRCVIEAVRFLNKRKLLSI